MQYKPRGPIKGQVYADFVVHLPAEATKVDGGDFLWSSQWMDPLTSKVAGLGYSRGT